MANQEWTRCPPRGSRSRDHSHLTAAQAAGIARDAGARKLVLTHFSQRYTDWREFLDEAFSDRDLDWNDYVRIDPRYERPAEVDMLIGDATRARNELGWEPDVSFRELVKIMVDADMEKVGLEPPGDGNEILRKKYPERWWGAP